MATLDFVRGIVKNSFYLIGIPSTGQQIIYTFASQTGFSQGLSTGVQQVYLSSRPEERPFALTFTFVPTSPGDNNYYLSCDQATNVKSNYLGSIKTFNGLGSTVMGLTSSTQALIMQINQNFNVGSDRISGAKYQLTFEGSVDQVQYTADANYASLNNTFYYSTPDIVSTNSYYTTSIISMGNQNVLNGLNYYLIPKIVYGSSISEVGMGTNMDGLAALYAYLNGSTVSVFSNELDATIGEMYDYCTGNEQCGDGSSCMGLCSDGLFCMNQGATNRLCTSGSGTGTGTGTKTVSAFSLASLANNPVAVGIGLLIFIVLMILILVALSDTGYSKSDVEIIRLLPGELVSRNSEQKRIIYPPPPQDIRHSISSLRLNSKTSPPHVSPPRSGRPVQTLIQPIYPDSQPITRLPSPFRLSPQRKLPSVVV